MALALAAACAAPAPAASPVLSPLEPAASPSPTPFVIPSATSTATATTVPPPPLPPAVPVAPTAAAPTATSAAAVAPDPQPAARQSEPAPPDNPLRVRVEPPEVLQGGAFSLGVDSDEPLRSVTARVDGRALAFRVEGARAWALAGFRSDVTPGRRSIPVEAETASGRSLRATAAVSVGPGRFPVEQITIEPGDDGEDLLAAGVPPQGPPLRADCLAARRCKPGAFRRSR